MRVFTKNVNSNTSPHTSIKKRLLLVSILIAIIFVLLGLRISYISIEKGDEYNRIVLSQRQTSYNSEIIPSRRGDILDSDGNLLATSIKVYNLIIDPKVILSYDDNRYLNATIDALKSLRMFSDVAKKRGLSMAELLN